MIKLKELLKEDTGERDYKKLQNHLEKYLDMKNFNKKYSNKNDITVTYSNKRQIPFFSQTYIIQYEPNNLYDFRFRDENNIFILCEVAIHYDVQSLADPRATYQTTSAKRVKTKKVKLRDLFSDVNSAIKAIDKFFVKLKKQANKLGINY